MTTFLTGLLVFIPIGLGALIIWLMTRYVKNGFVEVLRHPVYDERQQQLKSKSVTYAFVTSDVIAFLYLVLGFWIFPTVSARFVVSTFFWLPTTILVAHSIWTGSYFAVNAKRRHYTSLFIGLALISLFMLGMVVTTSMVEPLDNFFSHNGSGQALFVPLCGLVESVVYFYRSWLEKRESEDE